MSGAGNSVTSGGAFFATEQALPDELRVVVPLAGVASQLVYVRVLTRGAGNDVHDNHNPSLLASQVVVSVSDGQGAVAATAVEAASVDVFAGTYMAYKVTLARAVVPGEIVAVSVRSPHVHLASGVVTTAPAALVTAPPVVEVRRATGAAAAQPPAWAPTGEIGVSSAGVPSPHKLVLSKSVDVRFEFAAPADFAPDAAASFSATVNGAPLSLAGATVVGKALVVPCTAASSSDQRYVLVAFGRMFAFTVSAAQVFEYPAISSTARSVPYVTLGNPLGITSTFSASLPAAMTASVVVTPAGGSASTYSSPAIDGQTVRVDHTVQQDAAHSGVVTLSYGSTSSEYAWASGTLTSAHIYTFPSAFTYSGLANGYQGGAHLKAGTAGTLVLTFAGGDMLHSSVAASQVSYVRFTQGSTETSVAGATCSDPLETMTFALTPPAREGLVLKVRLLGPDGTLGPEMTRDVPVAHFEAPSNAVATTAGLQLWLDGSDPLGTGEAPADGTAVATWVDKSGLNRHAAVQTVTSSKFRSRAKNGNGAVEFTTDWWGQNMSGTLDPTTKCQHYISPIPSFPGSAFTIFAVCNTSSGGGLCASPARTYPHVGLNNGSLGIYPGHSPTVRACGSTTANDAIWNTSGGFKFNASQRWTLVSVRVSGTRCFQHINGYEVTEGGGVQTTNFSNLVIGNDSSTHYDAYFVGHLAELAVYAGALDAVAMRSVQRALGQKWALWPYNLSPLWDVADYTNGDAFGAFMGAFFGNAGNWGSAVYWEWFRTTFDLSLLDQTSETNYETLPGVHVNMHPQGGSSPYGHMAYLLNNPSSSTYDDVRPATDAPWAVRWGYQAGQRPTHVALRHAGFSSAAARYTLTGFASSAFTGGTLLATLDGTRCGTSGAYVWTSLTVVGKFTHFELRQTTGPFGPGEGRGVLLGRSSATDTSGFGSVARTNITCWLDGSDPHVTGEPLADGAMVRRLVDKSGRGAHGVVHTGIVSENSLAFRSPEASSTAVGVTTLPRQWGSNVGGLTQTIGIKIQLSASYVWPAYYTVCMMARLSRVSPSGGTWYLYQNGWWNGNMAVFQDTFQVTSCGVYTPLTQMTTKKMDGTYVYPTQGEWMFVAMVVQSNGNPSTVVPYFNGTRLQTITGRSEVDSGTSHRLRLFEVEGNDRSYGDIGEFAFYDRALTDGEISALGANLASKFGVTLAPA
jgi:hypothetical protein